ncbi:hypothetical protein HUW62_29365 [Myxococcus sp. AM011]|uniref:hypothetical protein n=1 Tax=Myxococcus sp. AM011 TaxID=2745200 RepID=UPI0015953026|nr:hypothetical protein [Myxococcus sp. AM011]NVJ25341.1 hypothetical protein [Myxococcus sp. AM011]
MRQGKDKAFEMARSLLPSTKRQQARENRAIVTRSTRRTARTRIAQLIRAPELAEDCAELDEDASLELRWVVARRRDGDKVNPFIRWAKQRTLDEPRDLRAELIRKTLPEGLIGRHALSHLKREEHFLSTIDLPRRWGVNRTPWRRKPLSDRGVMAQILRGLLQVPGGQKAFNGYLKRASASSWSWRHGRDGRRHLVLHGHKTPRLLMGVHDVLTFLDDVGVRPWPPHSKKPVCEPASTREPTLTFLRAFHRLGGDLTATLAALPPVPRLSTLPAGGAHGP